MSRFKKIVFAIYSIYIIGLIGCMYFVLVPGNSFGEIIISKNFNTYLPYLAGIAVFIILVRLLIVLVQKSDQSYLLLEDNDGGIRLSDRSIERTVLFVLKEHTYIRETSVKVSIKNDSSNEDRLSVLVKCGYDEDVLFDLISKERNLSSSLVETDLQEGLNKESRLEETGDLDRANYKDEIVLNNDGLEDFFKLIQEQAHVRLEDFLGFRIGKLDMKFYPVDKKDDNKKKYKSDKKDKEPLKRIYNKKVSRVK